MLREFFAREIDAARDSGVLLSLHLKATMMKVSDPIMFGHAVTVFYRDVFDKHAELFAELGVDPDNGIGDVYAKIQDLAADQRAEIEADIAPSMSRDLHWPWSIPIEALPTSTCPAT